MEASGDEYEEEFGARYQGRSTDPNAIRNHLKRAKELLSLSFGGDDEAFRLARTDAGRNAALQTAIEEANEAIERLDGALEALQRPDLSTTPLDELVAIADSATPPLQDLAEVAPGILRRLETPVRNIDELAALAERMDSLSRIERDDADRNHELAADFGDHYSGPDTDWGAVEEWLKWTKRAFELAGTPPKSAFRHHLAKRSPSSEYKEQAAGVRNTRESFLEAFAEIGADFDAGRTRWGSWSDAPYDELRAYAEDLAREPESAHEWLRYLDAGKTLDDELGDGALHRIRECAEDSAQVPGIVLRCVYGTWLQDLYETDAVLQDFNRKDYETVRDRFLDLDRKQLRSNQTRVRRRCFGRYPTMQSAFVGELRVLRGELSKRRRRLSVRRLIRETPHLLQALKPCLLMSPLAVSQYLPRGLKSETMAFDVVIFDEASQVFPEDAVPAIARAESVIVGGDSKQLPPTSFFQTMDSDGPDDAGEDDELDDAMADRESILDVMVGLTPDAVEERHLSVHYRSQHESLIRYSNHWFYKDRLLTFPDPGRKRSGLGIVDEFVEGGRFDSGGARTNRVEAEAVVDRVFDMMRRTPEDESIGVVALSRAQADLIESLVDRRRLDARDLDDRFRESRHERFFVKNLENVQGDERDHIILSLTYGPIPGRDPDAVPQRFGPVNQAGGGRRLNVAVTRARRSMTVFHSLKPSHILAESRHEGPRLLRRYLEFVENPEGAFAHAENGAGAGPESEFEVEVLRALRERGHRVAPQVGVSGYRIDLGIRSETGDGFDLGVECDGARYHSAPARGIGTGYASRCWRVWGGESTACGPRRGSATRTLSCAPSKTPSPQRAHRSVPRTAAGKHRIPRGLLRAAHRFRRSPTRLRTGLPPRRPVRIHRPASPCSRSIGRRLRRRRVGPRSLYCLAPSPMSTTSIGSWPSKPRCTRT